MARFSEENIVKSFIGITVTPVFRAKYSTTLRAQPHSSVTHRASRKEASSDLRPIYVERNGGDDE